MTRLTKMGWYLFALLPLATLVYLSLVQTWTYPTLFQAEWNFMQWAQLFEAHPSLSTAFLNSIVLGLVMGSGGLIFGFVVARELAAQRSKSAWLQVAFYPYLIAPVVLGAMLQYYFVLWGWSASFFGVMIAQALFILPFSVLIMSNFWTEETRSYLHLGSSLGGSPQALRKALLYPLAKPWMLLTFVQCFLMSWFEYGMTQLVGIGKVPTLTVLSMSFLKEANPHPAALAGILMILPLVLLFSIVLPVLDNKRQFRWAQFQESKNQAIQP